MKLKVLIGMLIYAFWVIKLGTYLAGRKIYKLAQDGNVFLVALFNSPLCDLFSDWAWLKLNKDKEELSDRVIAQYMNDEIGGYGSVDFTKSSDSFLEQQRAIVIPYVNKYMMGRDIIEIGTGNGDVIAYLAKNNPKKSFIGIDFSIKNAEQKHHLPNLKFIKGYALNMLKDGLRSDLLFVTSTFTPTAPKILHKYFELFKKNKIEFLVISEPCWGGYQQKNNSDVISKHFERNDFFHNYAGYLRKYGYTIREFNFFKYTPPKCNRPDVFQTIVVGQLIK